MANFPEHFERQYQSHLKHLKLKGLQPKTIDAYARGMRRIGEYFAYQVDALSQDQLVEYFTDLKASHSWSGVKLDLYGLKFFTEHVLRKPWTLFRRPWFRSTARAQIGRWPSTAASFTGEVAEEAVTSNCSSGV